MEKSSKHPTSQAMWRASSSNFKKCLQQTNGRMATLLHLRTYLKDDARECESYPTFEEVLEALHS